jgi:hypothetical protein
MPGYCDFEYDKSKIEFNTLEELINIDFVKHWMNLKDFYRFSISPERDLLMAELNNGAEWWVIGYLENANIHLPIWNSVEAYAAHDKFLKDYEDKQNEST